MAMFAISAACIVGLAGCSGMTAAPSELPPVRASALAEPAVGTEGRLIPIQSDNVAAAGYDAASETMLVEFDEGSLYEYAPVPADVWEAFVAAQPHPWSAVGHPVLVEGGVPYRKVR